MALNIKRPSRTVEIVTDLEALAESVNLANQINQLADSNGNDATEAEQAAARRERKDLQKQLQELVATVDESIVLVELKGLPSSKWNLIVINNTTVSKGATVKDYPGMLKDALPQMLVSARMKADDETSVSTRDITGLVDQLTDPQTMELMIAVQELNTPLSALPKAAREASRM
ncbi:MAG: hypothetical protein SO360_01805 [Bifidobacterium tsurumiense]|uniref:hypothetical protein n=1 Tax=Bifidobacterium tsurumiense TaxID=356829 RepID=UPI002A83CE5F|nr:hypothetical protein [Bifidobacterium tsurumiense]MDY4677587.1 hypothetical protein [Bifidobacterium tsurumiense]